MKHDSPAHVAHSSPTVKPVWCSAPSLIILVWLAGTGSTTGQTNVPLASTDELKKLSFEELMDMEVISVSRRPERLAEVPSAIQVITQDEIRRAGATRLPEALRLAPNLQVAQVDSRQWAISARGFNNTLANKLLVLIDGRVVYTPLYAGVFWDVQDTFLEDIDRIEVISGPGATLWGANAVNGVINIITKSAKETQGLLLEGGAGTELKGFVGLRYGGELGENLYFRIYGKDFERDGAVLPTGSDAANDWRMRQGGFRLDWLPPGGDTLTVQGDGYSGAIEQPAPADTTVNGQNVLGRWRRVLGEESDLTVQLYWDRTHRRIPDTFAEDLNTYDLDIQHRFPLGRRQSVVWGAGYRLMADDVGNGTNLAFLPPDRNLQLFSGFVQDEITLIENKLQLTIGTKLEHNDFSGFEVQPSGRIAWTPDKRQTIWGAVSRAVRSPSRIDTDFYIPPPPVPPGTNRLAGGADFDSEKVTAYELGYHVRPHDRVSLSLATFYNDYDDVRSLELAAGSTNTFVFANGLRAEAYGAELAATYQLTDWWRIRAGYTFVEKHVFLKPGSTDINQGRGEGNDPEQQFLLRSSMDLPGHLALDASIRYVDRLPAPYVPSYFGVDLRLAWRPVKDLELAVVGQNLLDNQHPEFGAAATRQEIERSVYGKITWRF